MTIYTFPDSLWSLTELNFVLRPFSSLSSQSAWNPDQFSDGPTSEFWRVRPTIREMEPEDWRVLSALLRKLRGKRNKIRLFDRSRPMRGSGGASPVLNVLDAAAAGATSITLYGLTPNQAVAIAADDHLGVGENLYAADDDAPSNADGEATVSILPPLRVGVAGGDAVNTLKPTALFKLLSGGEDQTIRAPMRSEELTLEFMESPDFD